jgi:hypothetical protein
MNGGGLGAESFGVRVMAFDVRNFLRHISTDLLQAYFESKGSAVPTEWLKLSHIKLAGHLADRVMSGDDPASEAVLANLTRLLPMATELGRGALLNAAANEPAKNERVFTFSITMPRVTEGATTARMPEWRSVRMMATEQRSAVRFACSIVDVMGLVFPAMSNTRNGARSGANRSRCTYKVCPAIRPSL